MQTCFDTITKIEENKMMEQKTPLLNLRDVRETFHMCVFQNKSKERREMRQLRDAS